MNKREMMLTAVIGVLFLALLPGASWSSGADVPMSKGQTVYVPVYSHIYPGDQEHPFYLAVTLSIRNVDPNRPITVMSVDYYDSEGKLLKSYLEHPVAMSALSSRRYIVKESDKAGGSGASFLVRWIAEGEVNVPV